MNSAPRQLATVRPEPSNSRLFTTAVWTPAAARREKTVGRGCHTVGSPSLFHRSALRTAVVPGIRVVYPSTPWEPGGAPVPSEVRLVAVVDGTPAVAGTDPVRRPARNGASAAWAASSS